MTTTALIIAFVAVYFALGFLVGLLWAGACWRLNHPRPRPEVQQPTYPELHRPARGKF